MSFRRLVHLVVDDMNVRRRTYSLRSIDMSRLFRRPLKSIGGRPDHPPPMEENQEMKPSPLPAPAMSFYPPRGSRYHDDGVMTFMLLGGKHNKVVATDQTGRAVLCDPDQHAVHTLRNFTRPKSTPVSLTVGGDHLYVLDTLPEPGNEDQCFECLEYNRDGDEDWYPRVLPPPRPYKYEPDPAMGDSTPGVDSYSMSGDGSHILISEEGVGTYSFDTAAAAWSKAGDWTLPFSGLAEYVPEHGFWFGLRYDKCVFCAVDLASASARRPPAVRNLWKDLTPPAEWTVPLTSHLVHLGSARFCIARFFTTDPFTSSSYPVTHAVFTAVEVERCADADGGLRMVKHGSKLYTLLDGMVYWVL